MSFMSGGNRVREVKYLFIDGAYLQERTKAFCDYWFSKQVRLEHSALGSGFEKVFYYDCLPAKADKETDADYEKRVAEKEAFFDRLREIRGWHVIEGVSKRRKKGPASQKEVDILIAVDMLTHTYRKNMDRLTFIAGDQDFRPLVDAVVKDGMYVELWYDPRSISKDLRDTADARTELDYFTFHQYLDREFLKVQSHVERTGTGVPSSPLYAELLAHGYAEGDIFASFWKDQNKKAHHLTTLKKVDGWYLNWSMQGDPELLKKIFATYVRDVEWRPV